MYVVDLVAPGTVNTMPEATLDAVADHGEVTGDTITGTYADGADVLDALDGRRHRPTTTSSQLLEVEGVDKFEEAWGELLETVSANRARSPRSGSRPTR